MIKKLLGLLSSKQHKYNVAICIIVKDENPYLEEWVAYHLKIGVAHFFIYDNESKIPVTDTLNQYIDQGVVTVENLPGKQMQLQCYRQCLKQHGSKCKWIAFIDADEFIVPKKHSGNLPQFLTAYDAYAGLAIHWLLFGSNGHIEKQNSQIHNYTKRALVSHPINGHVKSIVQPKFVTSTSTDPHIFIYKRRKFCVDENFKKVTQPIRQHTSNTIQLNHYNLRSLSEYMEKIQRGRADADIPREMSYFHEHDKDANMITDESIIELEMLIKVTNK